MKKKIIKFEIIQKAKLRTIILCIFVVSKNVIKLLREFKIWQSDVNGIKQ